MPDEWKRDKIYEYSLEVCFMLESALSDETNKGKSRSTILYEMDAQKILQIEKKAEIYKQEKTL